MTTSTAKMSKVAQEVAEDYTSSLSDLTVNSKPLINMLTMIAEENIMHAPIIVQAVERHLQKVQPEIKLPVLYLIDSIVKNVGDTYRALFTQNIVSTFCSVFEKVDERTRAQMFKLRQTWNEVFPSKKLYAVDVRVNAADPAWPITAVHPNIHLNPKFFQQQAAAAAAAAAAASAVSTSAATPTTTSPAATAVPTVTTNTTSTTTTTPAEEDTNTLSAAKMREQLLKKQKELLELQQRKLELELLQTKARLEEQQKQLEKQTGQLQSEPVQNLLLPALQTIVSEAAKSAVISRTADKSSSLKSQSAKRTVGASQNSSAVAVTKVTPATIKTTSGSSRVKLDAAATVAGKKTSITSSSVSSSSRAVPTTTSAPSVRSRDPRLASRQSQPSIVSVNNNELQNEEIQESDAIFDQVKLETAKPKPQITINLGCANKGSVNKESRGISKKDPRLISNKVHGLSNSNIKGRITSAASSGVGSKGGGKLSGRGSSPKSSSPSPSRSNSSGGGKTSTSPSSSSSVSTSSPRKVQNKGGSNGNGKPRNKISPKIIDLTDSPPPKLGDTKEESINKEKGKENNETVMVNKSMSSPSKTESHRKKSSPLSTNKSPSERKKSSKNDSDSVGYPGNTASNKKDQGKSPEGGEKKRNRDHSEHDRITIRKFNDLFETEGDSPSPPPPRIVNADVKKREESSLAKGSMFKDVKGSMKGRNYMRRNQHSKSRSPEVNPVITTGDVDLRMGAPPEKHPRLNVFQQESQIPSATSEEDTKKQPLVDVDLRQLPGSPKKRASMERAEQPPLKKTKAEVFDELFGNEDVDLRQLPQAVTVVNQAPPPSLSPPPVAISKSPVPPSTSSQDSSINISLSPKPSSPERRTEDQMDERKLRDENEEKEKSILKTKGWAKYKELKPDIYKSPMRPVASFPHDELDLPKPPTSPTGSNSPLRERDMLYGTPRDRGNPPFLRSTSKYDRLGRPLLYHRLSGESTERRRSTSPLGGEDTDMRTYMMDDCHKVGINVNIIMQEANEQLKNGTISEPQYHTLINQVIHLNEVQKLREAQRRDQQEDKENWERNRRRRGVGAVDTGQLLPLHPNDDQGPPPMDSRFGDIDERFPTAHKLRNPPTSMSSSSEPPLMGGSKMMGSSKFQPGPSQWNDMGHPLMGPGHWETPPHNWMHGPPGAVPGHLPPHMHMMHPSGNHGPMPYHQPSGPEFQPVNNFVGMPRWRPQQFQSRMPFESEVDRFEPRFSGRHDNRFRGPAPSLPPQAPPQQPQPLQQPQPQPQQLPQQQPPPPPQQHPIPQPNARLSNDELPPADPMTLDLIAQDTMRTINIDCVPREIRFYGDAAVVMLAWDDPREIGFQDGSKRITFDDRETVLCSFNEGYREIIVDGNPHRIKLGAPTRELYIDGKWYDCVFGGPPITIEMAGKMHNVKLEGPPPQVKIGLVKRTDLVIGKINLIINARTMVPVFLDAKPQRFDIEGKPHILRFVEALNTVLINGHPIKVEFGGLPKPIVVHGKKHFIRFTVLPRGFKQGYVNIVNMEGGRLPSPPQGDNENSNSGFADDTSNDASKISQGHEPVLPVLGSSASSSRNLKGVRRTFGGDRDSPHETENTRNTPAQISSDTSVLAPIISLQSRLARQGQLPLEMLTSLMPTVMAPATGFGYQVEQDSQDGQSRSQEITTQISALVPGVPVVPVSSAATTTSSIPFLPTEINVDELFQKLVATGIVPQAEKTDAENKKEEELKSIKQVDLKQSETLKVRQPGVVAILYSGIQCSSCGVRFPPEQTMKYSQHLDWHFRQNRRDRDNTRKAQSRKWYYDVSDWIQFEEIEDLEERAQSWFETQQAAEGEEKEIQEVPSVCAGENPEDTFCAVCHDKFEQFYNEEREEWHLRAAVRIDGKTYHPLCHDDYKASLEVAVEEPTITEEPKDETDKKTEEVKSEITDESKKTETATEKEEKTSEAMDTSVPEEEIKKENAEPSDGDKESKTEEEKDEKEVGNIEDKLKDIKLEPSDDKIPEVKKEEPVDTAQGEELDIKDIKTEVEEKETEEVVAEEEAVEVQPVSTSADTTHTAVACSIDGNVQFDESSQINTSGAIPGKIKINITKSINSNINKESLSEDVEVPTTEPCTDSESDPVITEASRESGEEGIGEEDAHSQEPPPPGVEPVQLKPRLVGRKLTELPPVMKGTELSGLCSIM